MTYPYLNGVSLEFDELPDGVSGFYSKRSNTIILSRNLFGKEPDVVLHEIQHIIQKIEGFSGGTSVEYWNRRMEEGYSKRGSHGSEMLPNELYRNTAGEIEARDTAARRKLSAEERRANAPARADENTVFADEGGVSYSIQKDSHGDEVVVVEKNILNGVNESEWIKTVQNNLKKQFPHGIKVGNSIINIDSQSRREMTYSKYTQSLKKHIPIQYADKLRATTNADEIILATRNYVNEELKHPRKDKIIDFARGNIKLRIANRDYTADVIVAMRSNGDLLFYDMVNIHPDKFTLRTEKEADAGIPANSLLRERRKPATTSAETIPYSSTESKTKYSARERDAAEDVRTAEEYFGTTYKISEAGYLLTDGKLLDFSGRRDGARGGYRTVDHREISNAFDGDYGDDSYSGGMVKFMQGGNIRLMPETGGINLSVKPNAQQLSTLDRYISSFRGEVMLDIDNADGRTVVSIEYPRRTYSKRVIEDINNYFDKGIIPEQPSDLGQFRYSMRDNAIADTPEQRREREMSYADLKRRNAELERRAEYWKAQTKETQQATVRKADTDKLARRITQELGVTDRETISELKDELKRLGDQIVQSTGAELSYSELKERALDMADELLGNISVQLDNTNEDALIRLRGYLSSTKLRMNEREMADLPEGWRRKHRRIKLSKDGVAVDTAYMELQEMFGEGTFPSYITAQADMLQQIA